MSIVAADDTSIARAAHDLRVGRLVGMPTETVYGLAADATNARAVAAIYATKGRPTFNPLIIHTAEIDAALRLGATGQSRALAERVAAAFWPGPITIIVPHAKTSSVAELATAGLATIALRVPSHPIARRLIAEARVPVAAPSANRSGRVSPTSAAHVAAEFDESEPFAVLDGGACQVGLESTILDLSTAKPTILRPGAITANALVDVLGMTVEQSAPIRHGAAVSAPGQLASHYAPRAPVRLDALAARDGEALLAFGVTPPRQNGPILNLSASTDLIEAAANLFSHLRSLDALQPKAIAVMPIPDEGIGRAINDRLRRAAAPR